MPCRTLDRPNCITGPAQSEPRAQATGRAFKFALQVTLRQHDEVINTNDWSFWAFPEAGDQWRDVTTPAGEGASWKDGTFIRLGKATAAPIPADASLVIAAWWCAIAFAD